MFYKSVQKKKNFFQTKMALNAMREKLYSSRTFLES